MIEVGKRKRFKFTVMAATESKMLALDTRAPVFTLPDATGKLHGLTDEDSTPASLVMFICNHCPFVKHVRTELANLGRDYQALGVRIIAINSNDATAYPGDNPGNMLNEVKAWGYTFPYLVDEQQTVAKAYQAACTPDFFVFDGDLKLVYRGQLDDSRPSNNEPVSGRDVRAALDAVLAGEKVSDAQRPSIGCSIKWKPGNDQSSLGG